MDHCSCDWAFQFTFQVNERSLHKLCESSKIKIVQKIQKISTPEGIDESLLLAPALLAEEVLVQKVVPEVAVVAEDHVAARAGGGLVGVAKVAKEVVPPHVAEELVVVDEPLVAELAQRVPAVGRVVPVALPPVLRQLLPGVALPLVVEQLRVNQRRLRDKPN